MVTKTICRYLEKPSGKATAEFFVSGTGVRASTIWHIATYRGSRLIKSPVIAT